MSTKLLEVREIFVYSWHCPVCDEDSTRSSMEPLKILTCEVCDQMYERTYKKFKRVEDEMEPIEDKENQKDTEQSKNPHSS
jgi:hypothetical protein